MSKDDLARGVGGQGDGAPGSSRRKFLRHLGLSGVAAAAVVGITDLVGVQGARAAIQSRTQAAKPDCVPVTQEFGLAPHRCAGGPCKKNYWCMFTAGGLCAQAGFYCIHNPSGADSVTVTCGQAC